MIPEATQEVKKVETQYVKAKNETLTDLASFNAYAFVTLSDNQVVGVQLTGRHGITADDMYKDFQSFVTFLDLCAIDHGVKFVDKRNGMYQSEAQGPKPAASAENGNGSNGSTPAASGNSDKPKRNFKDPLTPAELPAELAEVTVNVWAAEFDSFEVLPKPDEKASINFIKDGLQYPVGSINKWKYATIKEFLAHLTESEINPAEAKVHRIAGTLFWKQGNPYMKDGIEKHYKDVILVKPAF